MTADRHFLVLGCLAAKVWKAWNSPPVHPLRDVRPFARRDHKGLLWLLSGAKIIETERGARQSCQRQPVELAALCSPGKKP
jgi:hypothetical protein